MESADALLIRTCKAYLTIVWLSMQTLSFNEILAIRNPSRLYLDFSSSGIQLFWLL